MNQIVRRFTPGCTITGAAVCYVPMNTNKTRYRARHLGGLALAALLAVLSGCASGSAALYEPDRRSFTADADEPAIRGRLSRVTADAVEVFGRVALSPNGAFVAYSGRTIGTRETAIWRVPVEGGAPVRIVAEADGAAPLWPSFTPTGREVVYAAGGRIRRTIATGGGAIQRYAGTELGWDDAPDVARDGTIVFHSTYGDRTVIWTMAPDGSNLTQLVEGEFPRWSPDGRRIVFSFGGDIWLVDRSGTDLVQLTATVDSTESLPASSPDGTQIVFVSDDAVDGTADANLWTMPAEGGVATQLTELPSWDSWPTWGPAGILFASTRGSADRRATRAWLIETPAE